MEGVLPVVVRNPPRVTETGVVVVCAWCWPRLDGVAAAFPEHGAALVSHGICEAHRALLTARGAASPGRGTRIRNAGG